MVGVLMLFHALDTVRRFRGSVETGERSPTRLSPRERILRELDNPDPVKEVVGFFLITALLLVVTLEEGFYTRVWSLALVLSIEILWLALRLAGRRKQR